MCPASCSLQRKMRCLYSSNNNFSDGSSTPCLDPRFPDSLNPSRMVFAKPWEGLAVFIPPKGTSDHTQTHKEKGKKLLEADTNSVLWTEPLSPGRE